MTTHFGTVTLPRTHLNTVTLPFNQYFLAQKSPAQLGSLVAWWDASQETGLTNGQSVNTLTDRSGNGFTLTAIDSQGQPVYETAKYNGLPALRFQTILDAGGNHMWAMQSAGVLSRVYPFTVGFVASRKGGVPGRALFEWDEFVVYMANKAASDHYGLYGSDGGLYLPTDDSPHAAIIVGTSVTNGDYVLDRVDASSVHKTTMPAAGAFRTAARATLGTYDYPDSLSLGDVAHNENYHGHFGELALFSRALSLVECAQLQLYYKTKWGTAAYASSYNANAPTSVSGLVAWYKGDAIVGLNDGDAVSSWVDSSGNGHAMAQAVGGNRPTYRVGLLNGLPGVSFNGTSSFMTFSLGNLAQPYTVIFVMSFAATTLPVFHQQWHAQNVYFAAIPTGGDDFDGTLYSGSSDDLRLYQNGQTFVYGGNDSRDYYNGHVHTALFNGASSYGRKDGVQTSGTVGTRLATDPWHIGSDHVPTQFAQVDVAEVLFYNRALTPSELTTIEGYLKAKWGTP